MEEEKARLVDLRMHSWSSANWIAVERAVWIQPTGKKWINFLCQILGGAGKRQHLLRITRLSLKPAAKNTGWTCWCAIQSSLFGSQVTVTSGSQIWSVCVCMCTRRPDTVKVKHSNFLLKHSNWDFLDCKNDSVFVFSSVRQKHKHARLARFKKNSPRGHKCSHPFPIFSQLKLFLVQCNMQSTLLLHLVLPSEREMDREMEERKKYYIPGERGNSVSRIMF